MSELVAAAENSSQVPQGRGIDDNDDDGGEEKLCRFCFEEGDEENPLLSPCNCSGGQKYIHLNCLRKWQRINIVSQPTHPAFWKDDVRHHKCNVCTATFTCPPPSRHELMTSFTGPEIAGMIDTGFVIGAHRIFSEEMNKEPSLPDLLHDSSFGVCDQGGFPMNDPNNKCVGTLSQLLKDGPDRLVVLNLIGGFALGTYNGIRSKSWRRSINLGAEYLFLHSILMTLRCLTINVTTLPAPSPLCRNSTSTTLPPDGWFITQIECNDSLYSGHCSVYT